MLDKVALVPVSKLASCFHGVEAFVFDVDGVLCVGDVPITGAAETLKILAEMGIPYCLLTNTTSTSRQQLANNLTRVGLPVSAEQIFCPPHAAAAYLREHGLSAFLLVQEGAIEDFEGIEQCEDGADVVVVGNLEQSWTYDVLNRAFRVLYDGAMLIGLGRSRYWRGTSGLQLDTGPFIAALEYAAGVEALILGKPAPAIFETAVKMLGRPAERIAMIGDDIFSDVHAAMRVGLRGVLVRTGKYIDTDLSTGIDPDVVLHSVRDLLETGIKFPEQGEQR